MKPSDPLAVRVAEVGPELVADLADGTLDDLHFDEEIADFFEKVVKMIGAKDVWKARSLETANVLAAGQFWDEIQDADAATSINGDAGKLTQGDERGTLDSR